MGEKGNIFEGTGRRQEFLPPEDRCFPRDLSLLSGLHTKSVAIRSPSISDFRMFRMLINRRYFFFEFLQNLENWKRISIGKNDLIVLIYICIYRFEHNDCECRKDSIVCRPLYSRRGAIDIIEKAR